jgi:hypothetical protein
VLGTILVVTQETGINVLTSKLPIASLPTDIRRGNKKE